MPMMKILLMRGCRSDRIKIFLKNCNSRMNKIALLVRFIALNVSQRESPRYIPDGYVVNIIAVA